MQQQHGHRQQAGDQAEGGEQAQQIALVEGAQIAIQAEGRAQQDVADRDAEHQGRNEAAGEQRPVPEGPPLGRRTLGAILERHGPQDQGRQDQEHGQVEAGEADGVDEGPGGEDGAAAQDEPHLVALPGRADGVDHHTALFICLGDEGQERADAQVETVGQGEADQQYAEQPPPDQT